MGTIAAPEAVGSVEFVTAAGISYRQLDYWTRAGYLTARTKGHGHGYPRTYDAGQVALARLMGQLLRAGFGPNVSAVYDLAVRLHHTGRADLVLDPSTRLIVRKVSAA